MNSQTKAAALVQFLFGRPLSDAEAARAARPRFSLEEFRVQVLLSEEGSKRWPGLAERYSQALRSEGANSNGLHKIALQVAELRMDLDGLQKRLDGMRTSFVDALRAVDHAKEYLNDARAIQEQIRKLASRLERLDSAVVRLAG